MPRVVPAQNLDPRFAAVGLRPGVDGAIVDARIDHAAASRIVGGHLDVLPDPNEGGPIIGAMLRGDAEALIVAADAESGDADLAAHLRVAAFRLGAAIELPNPDLISDPLVRAYALATRAHDAAASTDVDVAIGLLLDAAACVASVSPGAAARYVGEAAAIAEATGAEGSRGRLLLELERAATKLDGMAFEELRGELWMTRARMIADAAQPATLQESIRCYQRAVQAMPRRTHPVAYAACHLNIAVAYLAMPMNQHASKLRAAIAVQSLRESLDILTQAEHPELWEAATLNLANALQHLPSAHVAENLLEAVSLYERVLPRRTTPGPDRARVLANLGNALAHLGRFEDALSHLEESRHIFELVGNPDAFEGVTGVITEIETRRAAAATGAGGTAEGRAGAGCDA